MSVRRQVPQSSAKQGTEARLRPSGKGFSPSAGNSIFRPQRRSQMPNPFASMVRCAAYAGMRVCYRRESFAGNAASRTPGFARRGPAVEDPTSGGSANGGSG